jgi:hypothetical protein
MKQPAPAGHYRLATMAGIPLLLLAACSKAPEAKQEVKTPPKPPASVPDLKVSPASKAKAMNPKPAPKAEKKEVAERFGKGKASIQVKGHPGGKSTHSFWAEELDVDGNGQPVVVDMAWDNPHKVLYISRERNFSCRNGGTADGSILTAVYGKDNKLNKPPGSGWWVAELNAGQCGVATDGVYGCRFDADGSNTECGSTTIEDVNDDIEVVPLPQQDNSAAPPAAGKP